jgi:Rod binding domain-containing protein
MTAIAADPQLTSVSDLAPAAQAPTSAASGKAHKQAQDFEAMFLSSMFQNMFTAIGEDGPLGSSKGVAPWRSFLTQEVGKSVAKSGGIGLADQVYRSLMAHQEASAQ